VNFSIDAAFNPVVNPGGALKSTLNLDGLAP
jgi:hypothetical protein